MDDLISRQAAIDAIKNNIMPTKEGFYEPSEVFCELTQLPSAQPEIVRCKDCKHFEYDHLYVIQGIPVLAHELCNAWGDGCKTNENGYCFLAERKTDEGD